MKKTTTKTTKTPTKKQKCKWIRYKYPSRPDVWEAFAKWMAFPKSAKEIKTQGAFAKFHEVSPDTLSDYKKKPKFWQEVEENKRRLTIEIADQKLLEKYRIEYEKKMEENS